MPERMFPLPPRDDPGKSKKDSTEGTLTPEQDEVLEKVAKKVVEKRMTVPALMFIESVKPLNFIGSQVMVFFEPIVQTIFDFKGYTIFREAIEDRENVELLMQKIEKHDAEAVKLEKAYKKMRQASRCGNMRRSLLKKSGQDSNRATKTKRSARPASMMIRILTRINPNVIPPNVNFI
jgi:hypothetical protein